VAGFFRLCAYIPCQLAARFPVLLVPAGRPLLVREPHSGHNGYRRAVPAAATAEPTIRGGDAAWRRRSCLQSWRRARRGPPGSGDAWRSPALWCCGSTRARPVGWRQNRGTGRRLSTALIDDLLDERFAANREQVTQPRLTDAPLRERTGAPAPSCQTNGYGYTTRCTHLSAPKRTARSLRPTRQELNTSQLGGYAKVRESIETKRGWRGSQLNPVVAPRVRASSRGSCFAPTVDKALAALIDIMDIKACVCC